MVGPIVRGSPQREEPGAGARTRIAQAGTEKHRCPASVSVFVWVSECVLCDVDEGRESLTAQPLPVRTPES